MSGGMHPRERIADTGRADSHWHLLKAMIDRPGFTRAGELDVLAHVLAELGRQARGYNEEIPDDATSAYVFAVAPETCESVAPDIERLVWDKWLEHGLTVAECVMSVGSLLQNNAKYTIRFERHPQNPDTPGGDAEPDKTQEQLRAEAES